VQAASYKFFVQQMEHVLGKYIIFELGRTTFHLESLMP
jgi:hypothetical protein